MKQINTSVCKLNGVVIVVIVMLFATIVCVIRVIITDVITTVVNLTGVCKINGVVIVVNCCHSIGFSMTNANKNTVYFANTRVTQRNKKRKNFFLIKKSQLIQCRNCFFCYEKPIFTMQQVAF